MKTFWKQTSMHCTSKGFFVKCVKQYSEYFGCILDVSKVNKGGRGGTILNSLPTE